MTEVIDERTPILRSSSRLSVAEPRWLLYGFMFLGLGTLLPWNFFITADSYWQYKLRNTTGTFDPNVPKTQLQELYTPMQVILSQIVNFVFLFINALSSGISPRRSRILTSLILMILLFSVTTAMVKINSDSWQLIFFVVTMFIILLISASGAIFQGGLMGIAGMFPEEYMCAVVVGQSMGGVFASLARIMSLAFGADDVSSAFIYFLTAVVVMILTVVVLRCVTATAFFKEQTSVTSTEEYVHSTSKVRTVFKSHWEIFQEIWPLALSVACVFMTTLAVFPVICVKIISSSTNEIWADKYFQPVVTFLLFNVGDLIGRKAAGTFLWPKRNSKLIYVFCVMRLVFIPLLLLCNHDPSSSIPSVFTSDYAYMIIMALFSISNGFCATLCMMYAPKMVSADISEKASGMMAAMLGLGLLAGSGFSFAFALIQ